MGIIFTKVWSKLFKKTTPYKVLILGLSNAGKTTILYRMHLGQVIETHPTIGCNVEEWQHKNVRFMMWDLGGQDSIRQIWDSYYEQTDAFVFVVDSSDKKQIDLCQEEFSKLLEHPTLKNAAILIFANKQDVTDSLSVVDLSDQLYLSNIKNRQWHIQSCSAIDGSGLSEGFDWLADQIIVK